MVGIDGSRCLVLALDVEQPQKPKNLVSVNPMNRPQERVVRVLTLSCSGYCTGRAYCTSLSPNSSFTSHSYSTRINLVLGPSPRTLLYLGSRNHYDDDDTETL